MGGRNLARVAIPARAARICGVSGLRGFSAFRFYVGPFWAYHGGGGRADFARRRPPVEEFREPPYRHSADALVVAVEPPPVGAVRRGV